MNGLGGDDLLFGDSGQDRLLGGEGDDSLSGGAGDDLLEGETGLDRFDCGAGDGDVALFETQTESDRASGCELDAIP